MKKKLYYILLDIFCLLNFTKLKMLSLLCMHSSKSACFNTVKDVVCYVSMDLNIYLTVMIAGRM